MTREEFLALKTDIWYSVRLINGLVTEVQVVKVNSKFELRLRGGVQIKHFVIKEVLK